MGFPYKMNKLYKYLIMLAIGSMLILNGLFTLVMSTFSSNKISDEEVIKRAKDLGYIDMKQAIIQNIENETKAK